MQYNTEFCYTRSTNRHIKELAKITNQPNKIHNAERYTPKELKELILAAQAADEKAIESLCETFKPLILKESHYPSIFDILGEDAVNTAWVIFLQFIKKYNGNDFVHLPGLIQCHLRYELMHTACRQNYCSKETSLEKALEYLGYSPLDAPTFNMALKQAMTRLTDKEQIVLRYCYEARLTQEQTAIKLGCSERSIRRYHAKALHKLKQILD